jgi:hypothetical protein
MLLQRDPPVDWKQVVVDLRRWGWTVHAMERALAIPRSTIYGWCNDGKTPRYEDGRALLKLHEQEAKKHAMATPMAHAAV